MELVKKLKLSLGFNLREPKRTSGKTQLYAVLRVDSAQYKLPLGVKVYSYHYDSKGQQCAVTADMTADQQAANIDANRTIFALKMRYMEIISYLCTTDTPTTGADILNELKNFIHMANKNATPPKRTRTATKLLKEALARLQATSNTKEATKKKQATRLQAYLDYITATGKGDSTARLTQTALNDYKQWLLEQGKICATEINKRCSLIKKLVGLLCELSEYSKLNLSPLTYNAVNDSRDSHDHQGRALTEKQVNALRNAQWLTEKEREYRDIFLAQCICGLRVSDLPKLFRGEYTTTTQGKFTCLQVLTQKSRKGRDVYAQVILTPQLEAILAAQFDHINFANFRDVDYNAAIKNVAEKAGLTDTAKFKADKAGRVVEMDCRICDRISSHWARHTFITNKLLQGLTPEQVAKFTGHSDINTIRNIYEHLTAEGRAKQAIQVAAQTEHTDTPEADTPDSDTTPAQPQITTIADRLAALKAQYKRLRFEAVSPYIDEDNDYCPSPADEEEINAELEALERQIKMWEKELREEQNTLGQ